MNILTILTAFLAGFMSFFSPCVLPLWTVYISLITGFSVTELLENKRTKIHVLSKILYFVLGFTIIFVILGVFAKYLFTFLFSNKQILNIVSGSILIFLGLSLNIHFFKKSFKVGFLNNTSKNTSSFLLGVIFALGWTPCVGPILGSILTLASNEKTTSQAIILLFFYSIGLGLPFFITGYYFNFFLSKLKYINKYLGLLQKLVGFLLVILGVLIIYGKIF